MGKRTLPAGLLLLTILLAVAPLQSAYAYIDPNSAGPLYQLIFPLLIAAAGLLAAMRRILRQAWNRMMSKLAGLFRRERAPERRPASEQRHAPEREGAHAAGRSPH